MKTVLAMCPPWGRAAPPLVLAYLSACARARGHAVLPVDLNIAFYNHLDRSMRRMWERGNEGIWRGRRFAQELAPRFAPLADDFVATVRREGARAVGFSVSPLSAEVSLLLCRRLKEEAPGVTTILGGSDCFRQRRAGALIADPAVDVVVVGEGEETLHEVLVRVARGGPVGRVAGALTKGEAGQILDGGDRPPVDLDAYPDPDFSDYDLGAYRTTDGRLSTPALHGRDQLLFEVEWSRGCVNACAFCELGRTVGRLRVKSPARVVGMLEKLKRDLGLRYVRFADPLLNGRMSNLLQTAELLVERRVGVEWGGQFVASRELTREVIDKLYAAGCRDMSFGVETGSARVARSMGKPCASPIVAAQNLRDARRRGMHTQVFLMVGFPTETWRDFAATLSFVVRSRGAIGLAVSNSTGIPPGSPLSLRPQRWGVTCDPAALRRDLGAWRSPGNSPAQRVAKLFLLRAVVAACGIPIDLLDSVPRTLLTLRSFAELRRGS